VITIRRATPDDADGMAAAHLDSIRSLGPAFYTPDLVERWARAVRPDMYVDAMDGGEVFFVATDAAGGNQAILGFSSQRVDDEQDGVSVYVRGDVARRGIGTRLLREAEAHAITVGASSIQIQASLSGVDFYKANGFEETGRGDVPLSSGSMPVVFMRKLLAR